MLGKKLAKGETAVELSWISGSAQLQSTCSFHEISFWLLSLLILEMDTFYAQIFPVILVFTPLYSHLLQQGTRCRIWQK